MQSDLEIKVCGIRLADQIRQLADLDINYIGLIFHPTSPRFVEQELSPNLFGDKKKVGVFVNSPLEQILYIQSRYQLDVIQLHGQENVELCASIQNRGLEVIRAFSVDKNFDFSKVLEFDGYADRFIFDARGEAPGGNGIRFDWNKLNEYEGATPFLLAGGISYEHIDEIKYFNHPACIGIDINSKFERAPGNKDIITIKKFVHELRN